MFLLGGRRRALSVRTAKQCRNAGSEQDASSQLDTTEQANPGEAAHGKYRMLAPEAHDATHAAMRA